MINSVRTVSVPVSDRERGKRSYITTLGFALRADTAWEEGRRWVSVAPAGSVTALTLVTWSPRCPPAPCRD